ncbi:MAG: hypothetical protein ACYS26_12180 [Planctomycetota bacterium]
MIDRTGALDVYFEDQIQILVGDPASFSMDDAKAVLTANEVEFTQLEMSK